MVVAISLLTVLVGFGQTNIESVDELKGKYEGAYDLVLQPIHDLNKHYRKALERLLEEESKAGHLEPAIEIKKELDGIGDGRAFSEENFKARKSSVPNLQRLRGTYLAQRETTWKNLADQRKNLLKKYVQTLIQFEKEQTKLQNFEAAIAAKEERESVTENNGGPVSNEGIFEGSIRFIVKGDIELWHNGERQTFRDESRDKEYIVGETGPLQFKNGDLIQMKVSSSAGFRSLIMFLYNEEKTKYLAFGREDYRIGDREHMSRNVEMEKIDALIDTPAAGPIDPNMSSMWAEMEVANPVRSKSQWAKIEEQDESNYYVCVLDETKLIEVP